MPDYRFHHLHLTSPDPIKTAEFYEKMFGANRVSAREMEGGRHAINLDLNGTAVLVMSQREGATVPGEPQSGLEHFGLRTDDITAAVAELRGNGVEIVQDVTELGRGGNLKIAFVRGPENVLIELLEVSG